MDRHDPYSVVDELLPHSESTEGSNANPRKRKKSSRACDFCHTNHQPCDNAKPRCSYCLRHGKSCLYLRPQKKRGPAQGYRSALHTMRESAAAWGAALTLIPSLGPVVEGYLKQPEGKRLVRAIRDPQQQEFFIQAWQQSTVFKTFFGDEAGSEAGDDASLCNTAAVGADENAAVNGLGTIPLARPKFTAEKIIVAGHGQRPRSASAGLPVKSDAAAGELYPQPASVYSELASEAFSVHEQSILELEPEPILTHRAQQQQQQQSVTQAPLPLHDDDDRQLSNSSFSEFGLGPMSFSDIVARDAARSSNSFSQTLGSLGFAPDETFNDFLAISYNPDPVAEPADADPLLGSEMDQKTYYELLMGRQFT
ncbi:quinic acid utilization activator [Grosmannia clavigera kw1407]|uniref:Quinic acid utilization activator n=1 Tax=Grosmannia clavigera (strain kw1407 / UAMH 11150) TaxID=655863 RepID=F0XFM0_GROCL|nr:quinic acid utilization activator [Grosmannia clavigera kw1407]EFX03999.1 quinic acid utilization activator [Grosmannia clavigera kw1407]